MGTAVAAAVLQGANNFRCVRVTDGTDTAATATLQTNGLTVSSKYTGTLGNQTQVTLSAGSQASSFRVVVTLGNLQPEIFDNIGAGLTANAAWVAIAAAINNGTNSLRGPSALITATAGTSTTTPTTAGGATSLSGGTDGATTITSSVLLGTDTVPRTGLYSLRGSGCSLAMLADVSDYTTNTSQIAYGLSEGTYMIATGPAGDTVTNAPTAKATAGIDSYAMKLMFGDWVYFLDTVNSQTRLVSPQGFMLGKLANLSPEQSSLNKQLYGIVGTQRTFANLTYSSAELQALAQAGIDLITNPVPGGNYFGARIGHNTSSNPLTSGDNYTRLTNYIASTLNAGMGSYIGKLQSGTVRAQAQSTIATFLGNMEQQGQIGSVFGTPAYSVQIDGNNNPPSRVALGYMQADVRVTYLSVVEKFIINVEGSQATVIRTSTANQ
jgi:hypothetical protein